MRHSAVKNDYQHALSLQIDISHLVTIVNFILWKNFKEDSFQDVKEKQQGKHRHQSSYSAVDH